MIDSSYAFSSAPARHPQANPTEKKGVHAPPRRRTVRRAREGRFALLPQRAMALPTQPESMPAGPQPPALSVVAPFFNEEPNVSPLVGKILQAVGEFPGGMEVVLVDDCSADGTWDQICHCCRDHRVRGVRHDRNRGQSAALWTGFQASRGAIIATLDGDIQNDPGDFPAMLAELAQCDLVCGVRTRRADTWMRRVSSKIARWARKVALGVDFADTGCNLRVFRRTVLDTVPPFDGLHRFMPVLARAGGARVREMPVRHHARVAGVSKYGVWNRLGRGIRDLLMIGLFVRRQLPILQPRISATAGVATPGAQSLMNSTPVTANPGPQGLR